MKQTFMTTKFSGAAATLTLLGLLLGYGCGSDDTTSTRPGTTAGAGGPSTAGTTSSTGGSGYAEMTQAGRSGTAGDTTLAGMNAPIMRATQFDAGTDPARNKVSAGDLCTRLTTINCAAEAYCCEMPTRTIEACRADLMRVCTNELYIDRIAANPISGFDAAAAEVAYTELENKASQCDPTVASWGGSQDGLRGILKGTIAPDGNCKPPQTIPDAPSIAAAVVSCSDAPTHACGFTSIVGAWTCLPKVAAGGSCNTDNNCNDGSYCELPTLNVVGSCAAQKDVGASCDHPTECASLFCKSGVCVAADKKAAYCLQN